VALRRPGGTVRAQIARGLELLRNARPPAVVLSALGLCAPRGLAMARAEVLRRAAAYTPPGSAWVAGSWLGWFGGYLLMRSSSWIAVVVACGLGLAAGGDTRPLD
jgi:hypothetical protein